MLLRSMFWMLLVIEINHLLINHRTRSLIKQQEQTRKWPWYYLLLPSLGFLSLKGVLVLMVIVLIMMLSKRQAMKRQRKKAVEYYGYKIFKFLLNQLSADILVTTAVRSLYHVVDEPFLRKTLIDFSATYSQTSQVYQALQVIKDRYKGIEVDTLCIAIEQGINTGANEETLVKMEELLFKKYIYQIKRDTVLRKKRGILSVLFLCTIIVLMIAIPVVMDIQSAFHQIFY